MRDQRTTRLCRLAFAAVVAAVTLGQLLIGPLTAAVTGT